MEELLNISAELTEAHDNTYNDQEIDHENVIVHENFQLNSDDDDDSDGESEGEGDDSDGECEGEGDDSDG